MLGEKYSISSRKSLECYIELARRDMQSVTYFALTYLRCAIESPQFRVSRKKVEMTLVGKINVMLTPLVAACPKDSRT
jgi:hypothetical protein